MNQNVVQMPAKTISNKHKRVEYRVWLDKESDSWKWEFVFRKPLLYQGDAVTMNKAIAMAKKRIDKLQEE